jgi:hypothetical protein
MKIELTKNYEIPEIANNHQYEALPGNGKRGRPPTFPFTIMEVGDSFFAIRTKSNLESLARACALRFKKEGEIRKFYIKKENNGCRVWRIQ